MDQLSPPSSCYGNQLTTYLCTLTAVKKGLPYGQPVCVCPSPAITTSGGLLRLAASIGPHISILQVYADIIDDWSDETGRQLTSVAKRHGFLIWEGGRVLNPTVDFVYNPRTDVAEVRDELVSLIRKRYTRGLIKMASWAGIATAWASGVAADNQGADILIPALRAAARETVAGTVQTIRTVITAESCESDPDTSQARAIDQQQFLSLDYAADDQPICSLSNRKSSAISLTQTISQHTEDSTGFDLGNLSSEHSGNLDQAAPNGCLPPSPLLARGVVLCLPSADSASFTPEYRESSIAAARANPDFVVGFLCSEPWQMLSLRDDVLDLQLPESHAVRDDTRDGETTDPSAARQRCIAVFSSIPHRLSWPKGIGNDISGSESGSDEEAMSPTTTSARPAAVDPLAAKLYTIVKHALELREMARADQGTQQPDQGIVRDIRIMHVPVVSLP